MTPLELFQEGRLRDAIQEQRRLVADRPTDATERLLLAHLQLFEGNFEAVRDHVLSLRDDQPDLSAYLDAYQKLVDAELKRQRGQPAFLAAPPEHISFRMDALDLIVDGMFDLATEKLD